MQPRLALLTNELSWPESPRWKNGTLYVSDVYNFRVATVSAEGRVDTLCDVPGRPAGIDFDGDHSLLLATGVSRELYRVHITTGVKELLATVPGDDDSYLNDLVRHPSGRAYFGETGFRFRVDEPKRAGALWCFDQGSGLRQVASDIFFPNGVVVSKDGKTLYVAETFGKCITAFEILPNGDLVNKRLHAELPGEPDGLSLDEDGCLWVPLLFLGTFIRLSRDGIELDRIQFEGMNAIACVGAGTGRDTLYMCTCKADRTDPDKPVLEGAVYTTAAASPGAGYP